MSETSSAINEGPLQRSGRLLRSAGLLDSPKEEHFEKITTMVGRLLKVPVALVSLVDIDRQFFKSAQGLAEPWATRRETPLTHSFCQHVVTSEMPLQVNDAREEALVRDNLAVADLGVIAYLGMPIRLQGVTVGSLCAIDGKPRQWTSDDFATLRDLASLADAQIALRSEVRAILTDKKSGVVATVADEVSAPLDPARTIAAQRAGDAALPADVRADFQRVADAISRQDRVLADLRAGGGK